MGVTSTPILLTLALLIAGEIPQASAEATETCSASLRLRGALSASAVAAREARMAQRMVLRDFFGGQNGGKDTNGEPRQIS
eukprot:7920806-Prorocentrum_lima.AAC.1